MTKPIVSDATSPVQPDAVDEDTMTTGAPIDKGNACESITIPPAPEQAETDNEPVIQVEGAVYEVIDPELGVNVVDLGLIYDIWTEEGDIVVIFIALVSPARPLIDMLTDQTAPEVTRVEGIRGFHLNWVWSPAWGPRMITEGDREQMRALGLPA